MWWWNDGWTMGWGFAPLFMAVMMVMCAAMMFFMMRGMMGGHRRSRDPRDILEERFARGEISEREYHEGRRILGA